jgi:CBS domain-containing protein
MKVADVMTCGVNFVAPDDSLRKAAQLMLRYEVSGFPVLDRGKLVGMITEGDFLRRAETGTERHRKRWIEFFVGPGQLASEYTQAHGRRVDEVMTRDVVTVAPEAPLEKAVELMVRHNVKRLPVVKGEAIVGILTRANLLHALIVNSPQSAEVTTTDAAIADQLTAELKRQSWAPTGSVKFVVENGIVDLQGVIADDRQRTALRVAAENIPGVKQVRDHLLEIDRAVVGG